MVPLLFVLLSTYTHKLSKSSFLLGNQVTLSVPSVYDAGFDGKAFIMESGDDGDEPRFKASLNVEAVNGRYVCYLSVLFGQVEVWSSKVLSGFTPTNSCTLELTNDGELHLRESPLRVGWRSGTSGQGVQRMELLRTGNLILSDSQNKSKWESFNYPANVMLWSQRLSAPATLSGPSYNSTWFFTFDIQVEKLTLYFNSDKHNYSYWEFRPEGRRQISNIFLGSSGLKLFDQQSRKIAQIFSNNQTQPIRFLALGTEGSLGFYHYSSDRGKFEASFRVPNGACDLPLPCGPYGVCTNSGDCSCMKFSNKKHSVTSICGQRLSQGFCGVQNVQMVELDGVLTVLRGIPLAKSLSRDECVNFCLKNCSCAAVMYSDMSQEGCFQYELVGGVKEVQGVAGVNYFVKVARNATYLKEDTINIKNIVFIIVGTLDGLAILAILGGLAWYFLIKYKQKHTNTRSDQNT